MLGPCVRAVLQGHLALKILSFRIRRDKGLEAARGGGGSLPVVVPPSPPAPLPCTPPTRDPPFAGGTRDKHGAPLSPEAGVPLT